MKWFLLILLTFRFANADQNIDKIRDQLLKHKTVAGNFKQTRSMKDPKVTLMSEGNFQFKLPLDLNWVQTKPFPMTLEMSPTQITQKNPDGSTQVITKDKQPVVFVFSSSFMGIFAGDKQVIEKSFETKSHIKNGKWDLTLNPKDDLLKKAISEVKIQGSNFVDKVEVFEANGNSTIIQFSQMNGVN